MNELMDIRCFRVQILTHWIVLFKNNLIKQLVKVSFKLVRKLPYVNVSSARRSAEKTVT